MSGPLPHGTAIVALGPSAAELGRRLSASLPAASLHGPRAYAGLWDESYERVVPHLVRLFEAGRPIVGLCAAGILIRSLAPLLAQKRHEPPVVAVAEDGSAAVPLLGGHRGANALAIAVAHLTGGVAAITTAGDLRLGLALDEPPPGWRIADIERVKPLAAALLRGEKAALIEETGGGEWLRAGKIAWVEDSEWRVVVTDRTTPPRSGELVLHPPVLALGIGCERGCPAEEIAPIGARHVARGRSCGRSCRGGGFDRSEDR